MILCRIPKEDAMKARRTICKSMLGAFLLVLVSEFYSASATASPEPWKISTVDIHDRRTGISFMDSVSVMPEGKTLGWEMRPLSLYEPAMLSTHRLKVSLLYGTWSPAGQDWQFTATLTDPADERLFKSPSDLMAMSGEMMRQTPARHWLLGISRRF